MNGKKNAVKGIVFLIVVIGLTFMAFRIFKKSNKTEAGGPAAMPVQVTKPTTQDVTHYEEFTGSTESVKAVDIRARVKGYLEKIAFNDGDFVKKGDLLFEIESQLYEADSDKAKAEVESAKANLDRAKQDYERVQQAVQDNAVSKQEVSKRKADMDMANASLMAAKATLVQAELNLSYTKIYSPIDGKISKRYVDEGNLVGAAEMTLLTTVVQLDPMYIYFDVSENIIINSFKYNSAADNSQTKVAFYAGIGNGNDYPFSGFLNYMNNQVDKGTGTIQVRGEIPNPDKKILPGMFVRIKVPALEKKDAVLVKEKAVCTDFNGKYMLVVNKDNIVEYRKVEISDIVGDDRVIDSGLDKDDTYIVSGLQFVRPKSQVIPMPYGQVPPGTNAEAAEKK